VRKPKRNILVNSNNQEKRLNSEDSILQELEKLPEQSVRQLATKLKTDRASISRRLASLEKQNCVSRSPTFPSLYSLKEISAGSLETLIPILKNTSHLSAGIIIDQQMKRTAYKRSLKHQTTGDTKANYKVFLFV